MNPEELAVLRILYKHHGPIKLSTLIEGFPDKSKSLIFDAVSRLQVLSYLNMTECSSVLYVAINRQMRRDVFNLLEDASEQYYANKRKENEILLRPPIQGKHVKPRSECSYKSDMEIQGSRELLLRIPKRAIKLGASMLVFSFFILGTISALASQTTGNSGAYTGVNDGSTSFTFANISPLATEIQKGKTIPVEQLYDSEQNKAYSSKQAIYEGNFTKVALESSSYDDLSLYYHYVISNMRGLILFEPIIPVVATSDLNSSLPTMSDNNGKQVSST